MTNPSSPNPWYISDNSSARCVIPVKELLNGVARLPTSSLGLRNLNVERCPVLTTRVPISILAVSEVAFAVKVTSFL